MVAIILKEFRSFFTSLLGYIIISAFLFVIGYFFWGYNIMNGLGTLDYTFSGVSIWLTILIPLLTMRSLADENKNKTDQLLITAPISVEKMVFGKYVGTLSVFGIVVVALLFYPLIFIGKGDINYLQMYYAIFGFFLLGAAYVAIGLFISCLTESQLIAAIVTFVVLIASYFMQSLTSIVSSDNKTTWIIVSILIILFALLMYLMIKNTIIASAVGAIGLIVAAILYFVVPSVYDNVLTSLTTVISIVGPYTSFITGVVELSGIVYYLSIIGIFLFMTIMMIKKKRWS